MDMTTQLQIRALERLPEDEFPILDVQFDISTTVASAAVPEGVMPRLVAHALRYLADRVEAGHVDILPGRRPAEGTTKAVAAPAAAAAVQAEDERSWVQPAGIDMRIIKSAHRFVLAVSEMTASGRAARMPDVQEKTGLSAPTMQRLRDPEEASGMYLAPFVSFQRDGRTWIADLTERGRLLASRIRAGVVPV